MAFYTLGCKVNRYESRIMAGHFSEAGFDEVPFSASADVYVLNSCTVTATGDKKTRQIIGRIKREHGGAICVLCGCYPQAFPAQAAEVAGVDVLCGTTDRHNLPALVIQAMREKKQVVQLRPHKVDEDFEPMRLGNMQGQTRAFVKIQDGCDRHCSYCIIPTARGGLRSKPAEDITDEVAKLVAQGYKEVVLTGINLSSYARERGGGLIDGVQAAKSGGIERIRLGSLEPDLTTPEFLDELSQVEGFCGQFHLAVQSGCDGTLGRMRRRYTAAECLAVAQEIRGRFENPAITGDLIVGFPGESEEEFADTLGFIERIGFAQLHVFRFSPRDGTPAADMPQQLSPEIKAERGARATATAQKSRHKFLQSMVGRTESVLFERSNIVGHAKGQTENGVTVIVKTDEDMRGNISQVIITGLSLEHDVLEGII